VSRALSPLFSMANRSGPTQSRTANGRELPRPRTSVAAVVSHGREQATEFARSPEKLQFLVREALQKTSGMDTRVFKEVWVYLLAMFRLLKAYATQRYSAIPWESLVSIIVAVAYFVSPMDLIPDFVPGVGYLDDAMIVRFVYRGVKADLARFMEWESGVVERA
jgi:uncharacterized membrane protein YkvA (DUF1232 family)